MSWVLGSTTLPDPQGFRRQYIEKSTMHEMINGTSKKDISNRKEQFILDFTRLSQVTVAQVLAEYNLQETLSFSVTDGDLNINATDVHISISAREYNTKGSEFREDVRMVLTEVT